MTGVFRLVNPESWLVTPVRLSVANDRRPADPPARRAGKSRASAQTVLEARNVAKSFGAVHALKGVNFEVRARPGHDPLRRERRRQVHADEDPVGRRSSPPRARSCSTGEPVTFASSSDAQRPRHLDHPPGAEPRAQHVGARQHLHGPRDHAGPLGVDFAEEARQARALMEELEEDIDPLTPVEDLRLGQQQIVEIARALSVNSRILIMDEPTSALSASEVEVLFKVIRDLKARGVAIVYISHHLEEALSITDHAVVLRDGAMTAYGRAPRHRPRMDRPPHGRRELRPGLARRPATPWARWRSPSRASSVPDASGADLVDRLSLQVRAGEIVCIYGLMGAGRTELLEAVAGRLPLTGGRVLLEGRDVSRLSIARAHRARASCSCPRTGSATASCRP